MRDATAGVEVEIENDWVRFANIQSEVVTSMRPTDGNLQNMQPVRVGLSYSSNGFVGSAAANCSTGVAPFKEGAGDSARPAICFIAFI